MRPELIGYRYEALGKLGAGGMGEVYRCKDWLTGEIVALKRIKRRSSGSRTPTPRWPGSSASSESTTLTAEGNQDWASPQAGVSERSSTVTAGLAAAIAQEFRILSSLRHPNIISVLDYGFANDAGPYFTMSLLPDAVTLTLAARKASFSEKIDFLFQILQALSYLHRHGITHRDLKPSNVLLTGAHVTVMDFGVSGLSSRLIAGTPRYMAPEILAGFPPGPASDLYAVGVIAVEILAGENVKSDQRLDLSALGVPVGLITIVHRLLSPLASDRYADANRLIADLASAAEQPLPRESIEHRESYLRAAPLIGRRRILARLSRHLRAAIRGVGSTLLLAGESGAGKSRLLEKLRSDALVRGVLVFAGRARGGEAAPYSVFRDAVLRLALILPLADSEASVLKAVFPEIEGVLGQSVPDPPAVDPETFSALFTEHILALFQRLGKPALLEIEDSHLLREDLGLLRKLSQCATALPLMIVLAHRTEDRPALPSEYPEATLFPVPRLNSSEIRQMSVAMLGPEVGGNKVLAAFLEKETEGNAFFLVEAVKALAEERGRLDKVSAEALPEEVFAGGIRDTVRRRLERIPASSRELLQLSAILGRDVHPDILAAAGGDVDHFLMHCDELGILEGHGYRWRFTHDKLREGVLREITDPLRIDLHRRAAEAIENTRGGQADWVHALAYHWKAACVSDKAAHYQVIAAGQMLGLGVPEKALELGVDAARQLGIDIPSSLDQTRMGIGTEAQQASAMLRERHFTDLGNLPGLADERVDRAVQALQLILPAAHISKNPELFALCALKSMTLTLKHGVGSWAPEVFATYAAVLRGMTGDSRDAEKYSLLAIHYDRKVKGKLSGPVAFLHAWFIQHWLHPLRENLPLALEGVASAAAAGDSLYECFCASSYVMYLSASGAPLEEVVGAAEMQMQRIAGRVRVAAFHCLLERQFALALAGRTTEPTSLSDATYEEARDLASICSTTNFNQIAYFCLAKMRLSYYYGDYRASLRYAEKALPLIPAFQGQIAEWEFAFYRALSLLGQALLFEEGASKSLIAGAKSVAEPMAKWAEDNPHSFAHKYDLVRAELCRAEGHPEEAGELYEKAATLAYAEGFVHDQALGHERAASFFSSAGDREKARSEARSAIEAYRSWGAEAKAAQVEQHFFPGLHGER